jgi:hypothetical protein
MTGKQSIKILGGGGGNKGNIFSTFLTFEEIKVKSKVAPALN